MTDNTTQRIGNNKVVTLHFTVCLADGQLLDTTRNRSEPVSFTVGDGNLIEGFEKAIFGLKAGDKRSILIQAKDAFGDWQEGNATNTIQSRTLIARNRDCIFHMH